MSKEKQIEGMAEILRKVCEPSLLDECDSKNCNECMAEAIYNAGYRRQREGEWVEKNIFFAIYKCSICGAENLYKDGHACLSKFCPNCGARMGGGEE